MRNFGIPFKRPENGIYAFVSPDKTTEDLYEEIHVLNKKRKKNYMIIRYGMRNSNVAIAAPILSSQAFAMR